MMMKSKCMKMVALASLMLVSVNAGAQSLKDILKSDAVKGAVTALTGGKKLTADNLQGTWTYVKPAIQLEGDNALKNVAGNLAANEAEKKLKEYCSKVGIEEGMFNYTFQADSSFTSQLKRGTLKGTYSMDPETKTLLLHYSLFGGKRQSKLTTMTAHVVLSNDRLNLLFEADKLLKFLSTLSSLTNSSTLKAVNKLLDNYDGMRIGFELQK